MLRNNKITATLTATLTSVVFTMVGNIMNNIGSFLVNLQPKERNKKLKVGNAQYGMIKQIERICEQFPTLMPNIHTPAEFYTKVRNMDELRKMQTAVRSLLRGIDDTVLVANEEAFRIGLDYYKGLKIAADGSQPGLYVLYREVRDNFIHETGHEPEDEIPTEDDNTPDDGTAKS